MARLARGPAASAGLPCDVWRNRDPASHTHAPLLQTRRTEAGCGPEPAEPRGARPANGEHTNSNVRIQRFELACTRRPATSGSACQAASEQAHSAPARMSALYAREHGQQHISSGCLLSMSSSTATTAGHPPPASLSTRPAAARC